MGELLLCCHSLAAIPYYIEELSIRIYSLEELCYVIEHHFFMLDETFFRKELVTWIEQQAGAKELANQLRQCLERRERTDRLVESVLYAVNYVPYETSLKIIAQIREIQNKTVFERRKLLADYDVDMKKYAKALFEYKKLLQMKEECRANPIMCGNIWHNQGIVLARLFLFREAKECFEQAYQYHMNVESIYEAMAACSYLGDEEEVWQLGKKYGIEVQKIEELQKKWLVQNSHLQLQEDFLEEHTSLEKILCEWKAEYRRNLR